ncbi:hypothetical protein GY45DRAFT_1428709 [Cubamyces sp. BRFM 1775]|nr:hypothetical protein GY45DRAFT_1428709 [Cubamyces sp. BRFM 1775]
MSGTPTPHSRKSYNDPNLRKETRRSGQLPGWCDEIQGKVHAYGTDINDYLHTFVPSRTPCNVSAPSMTLVENFHPQPGKEKEMYDPLVKILTAIVKDFPEDKRPSFSNPHEAKFPFPFSQFSKRHHPAKPDLVMSFPGDRLPAKMDPPDWSRVAMAIEAKDVAGKDPFVTGAREGSEARAKRIAQLAVDARSLMLAHGYLASYLFGVYGSNIRIARFDHTCVVASPMIDLKSAEGLRSVQEFFWRFVHPWEGGPGAVLGCDTTFRKLTPIDEKWLRTQLADEADEMLADVNLREGRLVKVYDEDKPAEPKTFLLFKLLDVNARLFSRSTMVWLGIEDTRGAGHSSVGVGGPSVLRVLKESWRQVIRIPEQKFYKRLTDTVPANEWYGLPKLLHGGDLGPWSGDDDLLAGVPDCPGPSTSSVPRPEDVPHPMHQTFSLRLCGVANAKYMERSHVRFVVDTVGRPLSRFKTTKELAMAMRDAIKGHHVATRYGGILHRDVSSGNILIVDRPIPDKPDCKGVLHDFDYSSMTAVPPPPGDAQSALSEAPPLHRLEVDENDAEDAEKFKERTGTYYFIAHDLIDPDTITPIHDICHDLESYYWVLLWVVLRHTNHTAGITCADLFPFGDDRTAAEKKYNWGHKMRRSLTVVNNPPLTKLLEDFKMLIYFSLQEKMAGPVPLTYEAVLRVFDEAIARDDWPSDDKAIPFTPIGPIKTNTVFPGPLHTGQAAQMASKGSKKRRRENDAEELESAAFLGPPSGTAEATVCSGTSTGTRRSKRARSGAMPPPSSRVTRSQSKRSGQV